SRKAHASAGLKGRGRGRPETVRSPGRLPRPFRPRTMARLLTQGISLRPQPWAPLSRPVGPEGRTGTRGTRSIEVPRPREQKLVHGAPEHLHASNPSRTVVVVPRFQLNVPFCFIPGASNIAVERRLRLSGGRRSRPSDCRRRVRAAFSP